MYLGTSHQHSQQKLEQDCQQFAAQLSSVGFFPFGKNDTSVGMEYELQVGVEGTRHDVDLPLSISNSSYYHNTIKRAARGDLSLRSVQDINDFLDQNESQIWENSWVRIDENRLGRLATTTLAHDLLEDKRNPDGPFRGDVERFRCFHKNKPHLRVPISYLLKLSFADMLDIPSLPEPLLETGIRLLDHFTSDNTSPEILSLTIPSSTPDERVGKLAAQEGARTFLVTQLLIQYANLSFGLKESGQKCVIYNAPLAPDRQKQLNKLVPDGYYRHLFLSPCLSGWDRGEEKHNYMALCHKTLSRSQLNTLSKLKDSSIITNNLVVLPNTSNTCLANNGTHVSIGSKLLTSMAADNNSGFTPGVEKYFGDLVIKIVEHFLPLFVTTYTAAPYRIDFADFHPEKVLGFLPHELDYTHLRMIWRRWKKKANIQFMGKSITPFGPYKLDKILSLLLNLNGDLIHDFRLIDYLVTLLSTDTSPALNGQINNQERLLQELAENGVFDNRMSIYLPYRMREFNRMGYSGFEGRSYSLFPSLLVHMAEAVDLQNLVTALAYRYVLRGQVHHQDIPDNPSVESERRQIFFGSAIGIPTCYVRNNTRNRFLKKILDRISTKRVSKRYKNYIRIELQEYHLALFDLLIADGADLIEQLDLNSSITQLRHRLLDKKETAGCDLIRHICHRLPTNRRPEKIPADQFNNGTEHYYRTELIKRHLKEGITVLEEDFKQLDRQGSGYLKLVMQKIDPNRSATAYLEAVKKDIRQESSTPDILKNILHLTLAVIHHKHQRG